jgi:hypothetical protein
MQIKVVYNIAIKANLQNAYLVNLSNLILRV